MIETHLMTTKLDPYLLGQVVNIAGICSHELSINPVSPGSTLYELFQVTLCVEVGHYLDAIGHPMARGRHGELVVAVDTDRPGQAVGFLMYCPLSGVTGQCGIYYTAVLPGWRRRGAFKAMLGIMLARYPSAALSCEIDMVPMYERFGFEVYGYRDGQVQMAKGGCDSSAGMMLIDPRALEQDPTINKCRDSMLRKYGQDVMVQALVAFTKVAEQRAERARVYAEARLAENRARAAQK